MQGPAVSGTPAKSSVPVERTVYVWGIAIVAALGGLLFGYDWVVIGGARQFYEIYFHLSSPGLVGWANSCGPERTHSCGHAAEIYRSAGYGTNDIFLNMTAHLMLCLLTRPITEE